MKKISKTNIHLLFIILTFFIVKLILNQSFLLVLGIYLLYFLFNFFANFGNSIGLLGYIFQVVFKKEDLAHKLYKKSFKCKTQNDYALMSYGLHLLRTGCPEEALKLFNKMLDKKNTKPMMLKYCYSNLAICHWKMGRVDRAIQVLEQMQVDYEIFNADYYTTLGFMYILEGEYDKATEITNKALEEDSNHGPAFDNFGQIFFRQNDLDKAERNFLQALEYKDTMVDSKYYLGLVYEKKEDLALAKKYFTAAYNSEINALNTVSKEDVLKKYEEYQSKKTS